MCCAGQRVGLAISPRAKVVSLHIDGRKGGDTPMWSPRMPRGRSIQPKGPTVGGDERWHVTGARRVRIKRRRRVVDSNETSGSEPEATQDLVGSPEVPTTQVEVGHCRRQRVRSEGAGRAIHHDLTLVNSSDDDAPFRGASSGVTTTQVGVGPRG